MRSINIGLIGLGTVGGGVARLIAKHHDDYVKNYGIDLVIKRGCARRIEEARRIGLPIEHFTDDWRDVVSDPDIDIVVELIGGEHPATEIFEESFRAGKHVVSANKALIGRHTAQLAEIAAEHGVAFRCEAAAAGGIPVVHALEHELNGNEILTVAGIMNGTTNYILSRMKHEGSSFDEVLADAQALGYAEADPTADVDGFDAASKIAILGSMGFRTRITTDDVYMQGIRSITATDIEIAEELGKTIKLLAIARATDTGIDVRVHPTMIPNDHPLASVDGAMNAVYVVGDGVGETMFYGAGAGSFPTASAVIGDIFALAEPISQGQKPLAESRPFGRVRPIRPMADLHTRYCIRLVVEDQVGTLSAITRIFSESAVSISTIRQVAGTTDGACQVVFVTHRALEADMETARAALEADDAVRAVGSIIRVEDIDAWTSGVLDN